MRAATAVIVALILMALTGCQQPPKPRYVIWVGSAAFSLGYGTHAYTIEDDMVIFRTERGESRIPMCSVLRIVDNGAQP